MASTSEIGSNSQSLLIQLLLEKEILTPEQVEHLGEAPRITDPWKGCW